VEPLPVVLDVGQGVQMVMPVSGEMDILGSLVLYLDSGIDSPHTRRAYKRHIKEAMQWLGCPCFAAISPKRLAEWRTALMGDGRGVATHKQALAGVRAFLSWAAAFGGLTLNQAALDMALRLPKGETKRPYVILNRDEVRRLVDAAERVRDRAVMMVMVGAGLRVAEVSALDIPDFQEGEEGWIIHVRAGKGNRDRLIPVDPEVVTSVEEYLLDTGRVHGGKGPLLLAEDRALGARESPRVSCQGIRKALGKAAQAARIAKRVTPHALRHTFAIEALRTHRDVVAVSKLLGHKDVRTTMIYLQHFELGELRAHVPHWDL